MATEQMYKVWLTPSEPENMSDFGDVRIQVVGTPGGALTPQWSLDGINYVACNAYDKDGSTVTTITVAGIYYLDGGGYIKLTGTVAPASIHLRASE